jgi:hypothetical protein
MKFKFTPYGIKRHNLDPALLDRVFDGPPMHEGTLAGFDIRTRKLAKQALGIARLDILDVEEQRMVYCGLTIQDADGSILGNRLAMIADLSLPDFEVAPHVVEELDRDGDCANCSLPVDLERIHLPGPDPVLPPTGENETTATAS